MSTAKEERLILAFKLHSKVNPDQGNLRPVAEIIDNKLIELNPINFCHTNKIFVTVGYQNVNEKFKEGQLFRIPVNVAEYISTNVDPYAASKYVTQGIKAERLKPNELVEIIEAELPDSNHRYVEIGYYPSTEYIFIRNSDRDCFGPFSWERKEGESGFYLSLLNDTPLLRAYNISLGQIFKIDNDSFENYVFDCQTVDRYYQLVLNIHDFLENAQYYEYASDEEIVRYCAKLAGEMGTMVFSKTSWDGFRKLAVNNAPFDQGLGRERLARLSNLASDIFVIQEDIRDNIERFLRSNNGEHLIQDFIERKRPQLLDELRRSVLKEKDKDLEEKEDKVYQIEQRLKDKDKELKELSAEVERKRKEANQEVILEHAVAGRNETVQQLEQLIADKEKQLTDINERLNLVSELVDIHQKIEEGKVIYKHYEKENALIVETTKKLKLERDKTEDELRTKLIELKPFVEYINGSYFSNNSEKTKSVFVEINNQNYNDVLEQQRLVVESVKHNLRLNGRYFESWQVANLLISTQQSFITFLAGLPGVGKTSLARLLTQSQGLKPRLQEVSVARGWTSQKDLIGFYNPLANRFQSANTGLYSFIEALSAEKKDEQAMAYVLLDEANLSPIEHYWSAFMAMADGEGARELRLGQDTLTVPSVLRFLATINYDGTTEPLSPRVVDRAPVIIMESSGALSDDNEVINQQLINLPLSAGEMTKLFGLAKQIPAFQNDEAVIFNKLRQILADPNLEKGRPLSISQRKEIVIRQYCAQASSLMRSFGCDDFKALDLAILQHVLPQVRGTGHKFASRLVELKQSCDNEGLKESAAYLERMLAYGETELHSYDFFCW
ncbi:MAG: hypothetical protein WAX77_05220 [Methylococcaceae bacterium]